METAAPLVNGMKMPIVGLGTWQATNEEELENALDVALTAGYRHIDTAYLYTNEKIIGRVLKRWIDSGRVKREELFIVTKLPLIGMTAEKVPYFLNLQLKALQLTYVDLYLIHSPIGLQYVNDTELWPRYADGKILLDMTTDHVAIWKALETEVDAGRLKSLGVSNFNVCQIERIINIARIPVANVQTECHIFFQQRKIRPICAKNNIVECAYAPVGSLGRAAFFASRGSKFEVRSPLEETAVKEIAAKHKKSAAQVLLRFLIHLNLVVIPKSTNPDRLKENFEVFDFQLTPMEMQTLGELDRAEEGRTFLFTTFPGIELHPERPF